MNVDVVEVVANVVLVANVVAVVVALKVLANAVDVGTRENVYLRGRLSTVDLLILTILDRLVFILKI